jgi:ATP-dependent Clp protease ATP-binding subunit ClpA
MGLDKMTQKLQEALQQAQRLASKSSHAELKSAHVLQTLLEQEIMRLLIFSTSC